MPPGIVPVKYWASPEYQNKSAELAKLEYQKSAMLEEYRILPD